MSLQQQLNNESIVSCLPKIAVLINDAEQFEADQMQHVVLQKMMDASTPFASMSASGLKEKENDLILYFEKMGWTKKLSIVSINAQYSDDSIVDITIKIDGVEHTKQFAVQLTGGEHLYQMGCLIIDNYDYSEYNGDTDNGIYESVMDDVIRAAESAYDEYIDDEKNENSEEGETWEYYDDFNHALISATSSTCTTVEKSNLGRFRSFTDNSGFTSPNDYSTLPDFEIEYFYDKSDYISTRDDKK